MKSEVHGIGSFGSRAIVFRRRLRPILATLIFNFMQISYIIKILFYRLRFRGESIFGVIHRKQAWGDGSRSGGGSDLAATETLRDELPKFFKELGVRSVLDAPCGDFHWMSQVKLEVDRYYGIDIVEDIITQNRRLYETDHITFHHCDVTKGNLPAADLILCRDCLVHLSNKEIWQALRNFKNSGAKYLLATTYPGLVKRNSDILTGLWRPLDFELSPFNFPPPIKILNENTAEITDFSEKSLGLWELKDLKL